MEMGIDRGWANGDGGVKQAGFQIEQCEEEHPCMMKGLKEKGHLKRLLILQAMIGGYFLVQLGGQSVVIGQIEFMGGKGQYVRNAEKENQKIKKEKMGGRFNLF